MEDAEEAPHARDERDLLWTSTFDQAFVMFADDRVPPGRGERCHIQGVANVGSATGDGSLAAHLPGVSIDRCDADESSDLTPIELAEFRQTGNQSVRGDIADTRN
jgi:hypothetical protein